MYNINELLEKTVTLNASDLHITVGSYPIIRLNGNLEKIGGKKLTHDDTLQLIRQIISEEQYQLLIDHGDIDISFSLEKIGRFRINIFKQRGHFGMAIRSLSVEVPCLEKLKLPEIISNLTNKKRGLILVTGPTGSGKSTTLASIIDKINKENNYHILTLEDPIEYLHNHNKSIVNQRELGKDFNSFSDGLRASLRQDPDVILLGEMRDFETISIALTAAETGHLVFSTLHTIGAAKTIDRIIDIFPPHQQKQVSVQLANVLEAVISQQLIVNKENNGRLVATEVMVSTPAIRNLIREKKTHQIQNSIQTGSRIGMHTMDNNLLELYNKNCISKKSLMTYAIDIENIKRFMV